MNKKTTLRVVIRTKRPNRNQPLSKQLHDWADFWYNYTFNDKQADKYGDMTELRMIIAELKKQEKVKK